MRIKQMKRSAHTGLFGKEWMYLNIEKLNA